LQQDKKECTDITTKTIMKNSREIDMININQYVSDSCIRILM